MCNMYAYVDNFVGLFSKDWGKLSQVGINTGIYLILNLKDDMDAFRLYTGNESIVGTLAEVAGEMIDGDGNYARKTATHKNIYGFDGSDPSWGDSNDGWIDENDDIIDENSRKAGEQDELAETGSTDLVAAYKVIGKMVASLSMVENAI